MPVNTQTRIMRPAELAEFDPTTATMPTVADARPVGELYRGRHRTTDEVTTRLIDPDMREAVVGVPLPARARGAAYSAESVPRRLPKPAAVLRDALRSLRPRR